MRMEATFVEHNIRTLLAAFPELEDDEILRRDTIEGETDALKLLSKLVRLNAETSANVSALKTYIDELGGRKARLERRNDAIRNMAFRIMDTAGLPTMILPEATLFVRRGQKKLIVTDEAKIPQEFLRIKSEPNKVAIKEAFEAGNAVPGCEISNSEPTLTIKRN